MGKRRGRLLQHARARVLHIHPGGASTAQLVTAFAAADGVLKKRMDPLSLGFRASAPAFYLAYQGAREIVDLTSPPAANTDANAESSGEAWASSIRPSSV